MTKRRSILVLLFAALFVIPTSVLSQPPGGPRQGRGPEGRLKKQLKKVGLDAAQKEKIDALIEAGQKQRQEKRSELRTASDQLKLLLDADAPDEAAIMKQIEKIGALKTEMQKAQMRTVFAVRAELTAEQRQKLKDMRARKAVQSRRTPRQSGGGN